MPAGLEFWESVSSEELWSLVGDKENREFVARILKTLTVDPVWTERIIQEVESNHIETRCFLSWIARELQPKTYLEIGVRRGFSMAMVGSRSPDVEIYAFDDWLPGYANVPNPGPAFVRAELAKVGYEKKVHFFNGDSHRLLPAFFGSRRAGLLARLRVMNKPNREAICFDLITIDGDHSLIGAYQDLMDTMPFCAVGGVLLFDDIAPDLAAISPEDLIKERGLDPSGWHDLLGVWHAIQNLFTSFRFFEHLTDPPGVGLAVRLA